MANLNYLVAFGFKDGEVVIQARCLDDGVGDHKTLCDIVRETADVDSIQVAWFGSATYGDAKHPDGKDVYRVHNIVRTAEPNEGD